MSRIIYHYPCPDGAFAAAAAFQAFRQAGAIDSVKFVPMTVYASTAEIDSILEQITAEETVYMCDYTGPVGLVSRIAERAKNLILLDHHKTGLEQVDELRSAGSLPSNVEANFDMKRSGAMMALDYFKEKHGLTVSGEIDLVYKYIQDHDLWNNELDGTKAFSKALGEKKLQYDFNVNPEIFDQLYSLRVESLIAEGTELVAADRRVIDGEISSAFVVNLPIVGGKCYAVISDLGHIRSELGNDLALKSQFDGMLAIGVVAYVEKNIKDDTLIKTSFRSIGDADTTLITKALGGGGHRNASSCIIPRTDFDAWRA